MYFDDLIVWHAGILMQVVHILCDYGANLPALHQIGDGIVAHIRFGTGPTFGATEYAPPGFPARIA